MGCRARSSTLTVGATLVALASLQASQSVRPPPRPPESPTFARDVAPIVFRRCAPCHRPDPSMAGHSTAPFSLLSYEDVKQHARQIAEVTERRLMPPWL